ncbi:protein translocase subunit SecF [Thiohalophilus thiocyanatoxydans]|uniref:Protein-export membrane protein SecF n=1 Tax=Thiohalophilus thiocyanatoxydans TaxID=381308 RepID=A0A4R8IWF8_9GAMM|nr:protein translocase subunit SecF [Thiohalophilus thiocyanatoxydans]TDY01723.1 protein translocase subunit secF [Thiohalophilus thiocyanatoxydans]
MQIFQNTNYDFTGKRHYALFLTAVLLIIAVVSLATRGLNFGLDFTGGTLLEVGYSEPAELDEIRSAIGRAGYDNAVVQHFGSSRDVMIRLAPQEGQINAALSDDILKALRAEDESVEMRRQEFVGPQIGEELRDDGGLAMLIALAFILIYVMARFEWRFAVGSIAALIHDVVIVIGFFSVTQMDFDLTVLAAVLAVIGYSLNDTIVVFDRIRENFLRMRKSQPPEVINTSLNQTLSRTVVTSLTTLLVVLAMFFLGGEMIHSFAAALLVGIIIGTYSSIYVASSVALALNVNSANLIPVEKEGADQPGHEL